MGKLIASIAILATLAIGRIAGAAEVTGWITHLDQHADQIILDDGRMFGVSDEINFSALKNGVRVRMYYDAVDGARIVTEISPAPISINSGSPEAGCGAQHMTKYTPIPATAFC
jgi:hypothetical protein